MSNELKDFDFYDKNGVRPIVKYAEQNGTWGIECWRKRLLSELKYDGSDWKMVRIGHIQSYKTRKEATEKVLELAESIWQEIKMTKEQIMYRLENDIFHDDITVEEIDEILYTLPFDEYFTSNLYENIGNYIFTINEEERDNHRKKLCCGIESDEITLKNGKIIYFAFDYGH